MAKKPAKRNPNGRPSNRKWEPTEADMAKVEKVGGLLTEVQLADMFGISERTLRRRFKDTPELEVAYRKGRATTRRGQRCPCVPHAPPGGAQHRLGHVAAAVRRVPGRCGPPRVRVDPRRPRARAIRERRHGVVSA